MFDDDDDDDDDDDSLLRLLVSSVYFLVHIYQAYCGGDGQRPPVTSRAQRKKCDGL